MRHPINPPTVRRFIYPNYGTPEVHPDYRQHSGQVVSVLRQLTDKECDPECQPMFQIRASDGWEGHANGAELFAVRPMKPREAWLYAAQWGSAIRGGDPGACMYGFNENFRVQSEEHRRACLDWIDNDCLPGVEAKPEDYDKGEANKLRRLRLTIERAEVATR